jgi:hypothetical protein
VNHPIPVVGRRTVGLLDDPSGLAIRVELYCDRRAPWMEPIPGAEQKPEAESS